MRHLIFAVVPATVVAANLRLGVGHTVHLTYRSVMLIEMSLIKIVKKEVDHEDLKFSTGHVSSLRRPLSCWSDVSVSDRLVYSVEDRLEGVDG